MRIASLLIVFCALLAATGVCAGPAQAPDNSLGLGLDTLHLQLHMTVAEAQAVDPAFQGNPQGPALYATYEVDGCEYLLALEFINNSLTQVELDTATDVESCKMAALKRLVAQYGPTQKGCPTYSGTVYMNMRGMVEVYVTDNRPPTPSPSV